MEKTQEPESAEPEKKSGRRREKKPKPAGVIAVKTEGESEDKHSAPTQVQEETDPAREENPPAVESPEGQGN